MENNLLNKIVGSYLQLDASVATVPGGLVQEVFQRLEHLQKEVEKELKFQKYQTHLLQEVSLHKPGLEHLDR